MKYKAEDNRFEWENKGYQKKKRKYKFFKKESKLINKSRNSLRI